MEMSQFDNQFNAVERTPDDGQDAAKLFGRMMICPYGKLRLTV